VSGETRTALSGDPRRLAAVERAVRAAAAQVEPDPVFAAGLRARLVALSGDPDPAAGPPRLTVVVGGPARAAPGRRWAALRRAALPWVAASVTIAAGAGAATVHGRVRPPGAAVERRADAGPPVAAVDRLGSARRRALEVAAAAQAGAVDVPAVRAALDDMDAQTQAGVASIAAAARTPDGRAALADLPGWASEQETILADAAGGLRPLRERLAASTRLLRRVAARVAALQRVAWCSCLPLAGGDDLGPVPVAPAAAPGGGRSRRRGRRAATRVRRPELPVAPAAGGRRQ